MQETLFMRLRSHAALTVDEIKNRIDPSRIDRNIAAMEAAAAELSPVEKAAINAMLEKSDQRWKAARPALNARRTLLLRSACKGRLCNFLTARFYRARIAGLQRTVSRLGINCFLTDYTTPLGLLALETLCDLRDAGANIRVYTYNGGSPQRSYRLVKETMLGLIEQTMRADYNYRSTVRSEMLHDCMEYTERGFSFFEI